MKNTRIAWGARWPTILVIAAFPAMVAAQTGQPDPALGPGQLAPPHERLLTTEAVPLAASAATFGTDYVTITGHSFFAYFTGVYNNASSETSRFPISGSTFYVAPIDLPNGVTVTEIEYYIVDQNAGSDPQLWLYQGTPGTAAFSVITNASPTTGSSPSAQTLVLPFTPFVHDKTIDKLTLGIVLPALDGTIRIAGARVGYTGAPGQLIMFPAPDRFVDTRDGRGGKNTKYVNGEAFDHTITGVAGLDGNIIPVGAKAILGNVLGVVPTQNGQFKILPGGTLTSLGRASVNFNAGINTGNAFTVRLDSLGRIRGFHTSPAGGTTDLVVDVVGYYR
jgi:hypothetical protein